MLKCMTCGNAVFDELWGEVKCKLYSRRIYDAENRDTCERYSKGEPTVKGEDD